LDLWNNRKLKLLLWPQGTMLLAAIAVFGAGLVLLSPVALAFYYYGAMAMGVLLAWRFHSGRALFVLLAILLAQRALDFFAGPHIPHIGPGRIAFEVISLLLPLNIAYFACLRERGLTIPVIGSHLIMIFLQSVFVAVLCRPEAVTSPYLFHHAWIHASWLQWAVLPQLSILAVLITAIVLFLRFWEDGKPLSVGFFWALVATFLALRSIGLGHSGQGFLGTAVVSILVSLVETSYVMAYQDELTGLPGRRAFNEALLPLDGHFAIAAVDIDHFKSVNDTFGHDVGDQVLCMVASKLAQVAGGEAFRCGGEEFAILFPGKSSRDVVGELERLRATVEHSAFHPRGHDRRAHARPDSDRRRQSPTPKRRPAPSVVAQLERKMLHVTISIGLAEPSLKTGNVEQVIGEADEALYRAKRTGRNRIELAATKIGRSPRKNKTSAAAR
jgi:GGDEF domain-containing protein